MRPDRLEEIQREACAWERAHQLNMQSSVQVKEPVLLYQQIQYLYGAKSRPCTIILLHVSFYGIGRVRKSPCNWASDASTKELANADLWIRHTIVLALKSILFGNTCFSLQSFKEQKVYCEPWTISKQHALVPSGEPMHAFLRINPAYLLNVAHLYANRILCPHLEQVKDERHVCVAEPGEKTRQEVLQVETNVSFF